MKKKLTIIVGVSVILVAFAFFGYAVITSAVDSEAKNKTLVE